MLKRGKIPANVLLGLFLAIALDTGVQLSWKGAVLHAPDTANMRTIAIFTLRQPLFYAAMIMFIGQFFNWMWVLSKTDLSFAQPITALSFISVCALSTLWLHETVSPMRIFGIALILAGVWFISQTEHNTASIKSSIDA